MKTFLRYVRYYEDETGAKWPDLLDKLAGGGLALGVEIGPDPAPAVLVLKGTDPEAAKKTLDLFLTEVAAADPKPVVKSDKYKDFAVTRVGKDLYLSLNGATTYLASTAAGLTKALDLAADPKPGESVAGRADLLTARGLLGDGDFLAWVWADISGLKATPEGKNFFASTRKDFLQTLVLGGTIDAVRRSDFVAAGLDKTGDGLRLTFKLPAKRADLPKEFALHVPPDTTPGSLPLLAPPGVVASQSFYLDLAVLWNERKALINDQVRADIEKAEKDISKVMPGATLGELLTLSGPYHRLVSAETGEKLYATAPARPIPPAAWVMSTRDKKFGETMGNGLRAAGLLLSFQYGLVLSEAKTDGVKIVTYKFPEGAKDPLAAGDPDGLRFNFAPSFAAVGDSFVVAGSPGLIKALIPELKATTTDGHPAVWRLKGFTSGAAAFLKAHPDAAVTDAVLADGLGLADAKARVAALAAWLGSRGGLEVTFDHQTDAYQVRVEWTK